MTYEPIELWTHEYFIDKIERVIKNEISMYFHTNHNRHPTIEEYHEYFNKWISETKCNVTDYDLGIFPD